MAKSQITTNHDEIRRWAEERDGKPVAVKATHQKNDPGILRIDFPGGAGRETLDSVSWDEWFEKFDQSHLGFLFQEKTADGDTSRFFKLVAQG